MDIMQFSIEPTSGLGHKAKLAISAADLQNQIGERLRETTKKASLKGFRVGRAPMREIKRRFGAAISDEIVQAAMADSFFKVVEEESLRLAGLPDFKRISETIDAEGEFLFEATFESLPDVQIGDLSSVNVDKIVAEITDVDVASEIDGLRKSRQHFHEVDDRVAEAGDQVHIHWMADPEGLSEPAKTAEQAEKISTVILDTEKVSAEIVEQLKGVRVGDEVTLKLAGNAQSDNQNDSQDSEQESKNAFKCTIKQIKAPHLPELNEEFFQSVGVPGDKENFHQHIRTNMIDRFEEAQQRQVKEQVFQALTDLHQSLELPKVLIAEEVRRMQAEPQQAPSNQLPGEHAEKDLPIKAEKLVRLQLVVQQLIKEHGLKVKGSEVKERIEKMAGMYPEPHLFVKWYYEDKNRINSIQNQLLESLLIEKMLAVTTVSERLMSYPEALEELRKPAVTE